MIREKRTPRVGSGRHGFSEKIALAGEKLRQADGIRNGRSSLKGTVSGKTRSPSRHRRDHLAPRRRDLSGQGRRELRICSGNGPLRNIDARRSIAAPIEFRRAAFKRPSVCFG
jgi:hypothetical protein